MSEADDDRTAPASPRRRAEAIARGETPHTPLLTSATVLLIAVACLRWAGVDPLRAAGETLHETLSAPLSLTHPAELVPRLQSMLAAALFGFGALALVLFLAAAGVDWLQRGLGLHAGRAAPDPMRLSPSASGERLRGLNPFMLAAEAVRWALPLGLAVSIVLDRRPELGALVTADPAEMLTTGAGLLLELTGRIVLVLLTFAVVSYLWRRWRWELSLRMTRDEAADEHRQSARRNPVRR